MNELELRMADKMDEMSQLLRQLLSKDAKGKLTSQGYRRSTFRKTRQQKVTITSLTSSSPTVPPGQRCRRRNRPRPGASRARTLRPPFTHQRGRAEPEFEHGLALHRQTLRAAETSRPSNGPQHDRSGPRKFQRILRTHRHHRLRRATISEHFHRRRA